MLSFAGLNYFTKNTATKVLRGGKRKVYIQYIISFISFIQHNILCVLLSRISPFLSHLLLQGTPQHSQIQLVHCREGIKAFAEKATEENESKNMTKGEIK